MTKWRRASHHKQRWLMVTRLMARDGTDCHLCADPLDRRVRDVNAREYITFDHIIPRTRGGITALDNLRLAHQGCNNERGSDMLMEDA